MKRIHFLLALSASLLIAGRSFGLQGRGQGRAGAPSTSGVAGNANPGNAGGGGPAKANPGGGNPGGSNPGGGNPGGGNSGGGNSGGGNSGGGNSGGAKAGGDNSGVRHSGNNNSGGNRRGSSNPGGGHPGNSNAGGGNSGQTGSGDNHSAGGNQPANPRNGASAPDPQGFKNYGQYVAAKHVSENLGIPLEDLRSKMTGQHPESLGRAIQELKGLSPAAANGEVKKAEQQTKNEGKTK